jgi:hypothetical protein
MRDPGAPPQPDELPGRRPDELPVRGPQGPHTPSPAIDGEIAALPGWEPDLTASQSNMPQGQGDGSM